MASRHLSRSLVLQTLFECDMQGTLSEGGTSPVQKRNGEDPTHKDADRIFADSLLKGVLVKMSEIDEVITKAAPQWPLDKIAPIDRNVLRIGLYELLFSDRDAVPPKVALNEAIELAKSYGGDSSGKFVNGVLGAVYRSIGEPGKDATLKTTPVVHELLGGVLLASAHEGEVQIALVHDAFGRWTLPKAKCADNATEAAAIKALTDELGVTGAISAPLGEHEYLAHEPGQGKVERTVSYYLVCVEGTPKLTCKICEGISDAKWFKESELANIPMYSDLLPIVELGIKEAKTLCR